MIRSLINSIANIIRPGRSAVLSKEIDTATIFRVITSKTVEYMRGVALFFSWKPIFVGGGVKIYSKRRISVGPGTIIGDYSVLDARASYGISIGNGVTLKSNVMLVCNTLYSRKAGSIRIGNRVGISEFSYIGGAGNVKIGSDTIIGQYFSVHSENHTTERGRLTRELSCTNQGVVIGENCWIGAKVTILDGACIGDNVVIAAGSVVRGNIEAGLTIGGIPAKDLSKKC